MKTSLHFPAVLASLLLVTQTLAATDAAAGWQAALAAAQQASPQDTGGRARADAILRAVLDAARNDPPAGASLEAAVAQAAYATLAVLYPQSLPALDARLAESLAGLADTPAAISAGQAWGEHVAQVVLAGQADAVFLNASSFAQAVKAPVPPSPVPDVHAEQTPIGPGRYSFSVLAGMPGAQGHLDGTGAAARFDRPEGIAVDAAGNLYVSEFDLCTIRKVSPDGVVTTLAGAAGEKGSQDGTGAAARFNKPLGLAVDGAGNVWVADSGNHTIRKIDPSGNVTTAAGTPGTRDLVDGNRQTARLKDPGFLAVDRAGNVFVTENVTAYYWTLNGPSTQVLIRKIAPDGAVSTLTVEPTSFFPSTSTAVYYGTPRQICLDQADNLYVIDTNQWDYANVVKLTPTAEPGHYAASLITPPDYDPYYYGATGIGLDGAGSLYIRNESTAINVLVPDIGWQTGYPIGNVDTSWISTFAVGSAGELYMAQSGAALIGVLNPQAKGPAILFQPSDQVCVTGANIGFNVSAVGGPGLSYQWYFNSNPISGATDYSFGFKNVQAGDAGFYYVVVTDGAGSMTSRRVSLTVNSLVVPPPPPPHDPVTSGGGSFDAGISLVMLLLLAAAAKRHTQVRAARSEPLPGL